HTRFSRDWSSDVCSSDLLADQHALAGKVEVGHAKDGHGKWPPGVKGASLSACAVRDSNPSQALAAPGSREGRISRCAAGTAATRSEERRGGKGRRTRRAP